MLTVISSSPDDLRRVFQTILANATRICEAKFANLFLYADNSFRIATQQSPPAAYADCCVETIGNQVEQRPRNLLREQIDLSGSRIRGLLQGDIEALLLGSCPVIGEIEALLDESVDVDGPVLS